MKYYGLFTKNTERNEGENVHKTSRNEYSGTRKSFQNDTESAQKFDKKGLILIAAVSVIILILIAVFSAGTSAKPTAETQFLRIHIRANSNSDVDQNVKYRLKDTVVSMLTPVVAECNTKEEAFKAIKNNLSSLSKTSSEFLKANGFNYGAVAKLTQEEFPSRSYDGVVLERGVYDALIIELGTAAGDNWWCVVYPPLCFTNVSGTSGSGVTYKSKINEIIRKFFEKNK